MLSLMLCLAHLLVVRHPNQVSHAYFGKGMLHCHIIGSGFIHLNIPLLLFIIYYYYIFVYIFVYNKKMIYWYRKRKGCGLRCEGMRMNAWRQLSLSLVGSMKYGRGGETVQGLVRNLVILVVGEHCKVGDVSLGM